MPVPDRVDTIERCAELSALLEDPFADRAAVLRAAGLDEAAWSAAQERWVEKLAAPEGEALIARYGEVYETTLRRLSSGGAPVAPIPDTDREGPAFLSKEAQPWRDEAAGLAYLPRTGTRIKAVFRHPYRVHSSNRLRVVCGCPPQRASGQPLAIPHDTSGLDHEVRRCSGEG
jgi:hypothetical protein